MQPALVLRAEPAAAAHFLHLLLAVPGSSTRAPIALRLLARPSSSNPIQWRPGGTCSCRPAAVRAGWRRSRRATPRFATRSASATARPSYVSVTPTTCATSMNRPSAVVDPDLLLLIARQAPAVHRRPVLRVADDRAMPPAIFGEVVPVARPLAGRDVAVDQIEVEHAVVVQIAELRAQAPAAEIDAQARARFSYSSGCRRLRCRASAPRDCSPARARPPRRCSVL